MKFNQTTRELRDKVREEYRNGSTMYSFIKKYGLRRYAVLKILGTKENEKHNEMPMSQPAAPSHDVVVDQLSKLYAENVKLRTCLINIVLRNQELADKLNTK